MCVWDGERGDVREMYFSRFRLDARGGFQSEYTFERVLGGSGLLPKKCLARYLQPCKVGSLINPVEE